MLFNLYILGPVNIFKEVADALELSLIELGHTVNRAYDGYLKSHELGVLNGQWIIDNPDTPLEESPYLVKWGDKEWETKFLGFPYNTEGVNIFMVGAKSILQDSRSIMPKNAINILYNFEQIAPTADVKHIINVFDDKGIYCPVGWSPALETDVVKEENIDLFYMSSKPVSIGNIPVVTNQVYYKERDEMVVSSKINLIFNKAAPAYKFPILRYLLMACKKKFVLSESHINYGYIRPDHHVKIIGRADADVAFWLKEDSKRQDFANRVYEDLKKNHSYTMYVKRALQKMRL